MCGETLREKIRPNSINTDEYRREHITYGSKNTEKLSVLWQQ